MSLDTEYGIEGALVMKGTLNGIEKAMTLHRLKPATATGVASLRMSHGPESSYSVPGVWLPETFVYGRSGRDKEILLTNADNSPILGHSARAVKAHRSGKEFYIDDAVWENLRGTASSDIKTALSTGVLLLPEGLHGDFSIESVASMPAHAFLFREFAVSYPSWLKGLGVAKMHYHLGVNKEKPYARLAFLGSASTGSPVNGYYGGDFVDEDPGLDSKSGRMLAIPQGVRL